MFYATLDKDGKVVSLSDNSGAVSLHSNQIYLSQSQYYILSAVHGDVDLCIRDVGMVKWKIEKSVKAQKKNL
jgi:hypothetical protein